jgi:hypothetical protein
MSLLTRSADLVYTFRFLKLLVTKFEDTNAYKLGIIDESGKRIKSKQVVTSEEKSAYTTFHRLVFSLKRLLEKAPGGSSTLASYAAALFLIKEHTGISDKNLVRFLEEYNVTQEDLLKESSEWFVTESGMLSPGIYKVRDEKAINSTFEHIVNPRDKIRVASDAYPVGDVFGIDVYEATHIRTNQPIYVTAGELIR